MTKPELEQHLTEEVNNAVREREDIMFIVINAADFGTLTGLNPAHVSDFGGFLGIPLRLGDRTYVRTKRTPDV